MKKTMMLAAFIAVFAVFNTNAQLRDNGAIEVIPFVSYTQSTFNGDNTEFYGTNNGVSFGVKGDYYFNDRWSLRSGLIYDAFGASIDGSSIDIDLNYLSVPVNANWHFGSTRKWNLNFGVTPGFLLSAKGDGQDLKEEVKSFQVAVSYGIGYKLEISESFSLLFDAQGAVGISNINDVSDDVTQMNVNSKIGIGGVFLLP